MELSEIRGKKLEELKALEESLHRQVTDLRLKWMVGNVTDTTAIRKIKKDIARVLTVQQEKRRKK